jgi:shikimate dehydrogenase
MAAFKLAVLGNPIAHSRSPEIHQAFARQTGIQLSYERLLVREGEFDATASKFIDAGGVGFNVTLPCKGDAYRYSAECSPSADRCEAVNTISLSGNGRVLGDNTDGPGLVRDLTVNLGWKIRNQRLLVLGAGGAVRGVLWELLQASPHSIHVHNRTKTRAEAVVENMSDKRLTSVGNAELDEHYDLIINGTSAGLRGDVPDLPSSVLGPETCCYDMVYGSSVTSFNAWCRSVEDCQTSDGLGMLVEQAAASFRIWFSDSVDLSAIETAEIISGLRKNL